MKHKSKYMPHIGKKEQERAKRCYMTLAFNSSGNPRATPVLQQRGKARQRAIEAFGSDFF